MMKAPLLLENALAFRLSGFDASRYGKFDAMAQAVLLSWYAIAWKKWLPLDHVLERAKKLLGEFYKGNF